MRRRAIGAIIFSSGIVAGLTPAAIAQTPLGEDVGPGSEFSELVLRGDCRMVIVGDSISVKNQDDFTRSAMYWGVLRTWEPERWVGVVTPANNKYPTMQTLLPSPTTATAIPRNLQDNPPGNRVFSFGYQSFAPAAAVDILFDLRVDLPDNRRILENGMLAGGQWNGDDWFRNQPLDATIVYLRTPETIPSLKITSERLRTSSSTSAPSDLSGSVGVAGWQAPPIDAGFGDVALRIETAGGYDESQAVTQFIWLATRFRVPDATGFQLDAYAVGGARLADWLSTGPYASDAFLVEHMRATGAPNLFLIQLGANNLTFSPDWADDYVELIDRLDALAQQAGAEPRFLLVAPYGTYLSIRHLDALDAAAYLFDIASTGTPRVDESRIAFVNLPGLLGGPIDPDLLIDTIHPTPDGADLLAREIWRALTGDAALDGCDADLTTTADPDNQLFGVPDGRIDANDYSYFLDAFVAGDESIADLTGSDDPADPSYGQPDGAVDSRDYSFFLDAFVARDARADLTGSDDPRSPGYGVPNGILDGEDYFFFIERFGTGDLRVDLTGSADPADPGYGQPDGVLDSNDLFYYFDLFVEGCR
ncbi:MAG: GC-type dockerin domain-anchored protein [Phycisphaerales bacterium JB037]